MTEAEWLAGDDPARMLEVITHPAGAPQFRVTDRKLRLFACAVACAEGHDAASISAVEECVEAGQPNHNFNDSDAVDRGQFWRRCRSEDAARGAAHAYSGPRTAALLREVAGNPWRPVRLLPPPRDVRDGLGRLLVTVHDPFPWLTPTVLSLAQAAYEERPGRACGRCGGDGKELRGSNGREYEVRCVPCGGTGTIHDGSLDPVCLAVLSDALEEAGCTDEALLRHLRGWERCPGEDDSAFGALCALCGGTGWAPLRGPHVRGCWALDLILRKE